MRIRYEFNNEEFKLIELITEAIGNRSIYGRDPLIIEIDGLSISALDEESENFLCVGLLKNETRIEERKSYQYEVGFAFKELMRFSNFHKTLQINATTIANLKK